MDKLTTGHKSDFELCEEHGRDRSLYCDEAECDKAICQLCLIENHIGHRVVDIVDNQKQLITSHLRFLAQQLQTYKSYILATKKDIDRASMGLVDKVNSRTIEVHGVFDTTITKIDHNITTVNEMRNVNEADITHRKLTERIEMIEDMKLKMTEDLHEPIHCFLELTEIEIPVTGFQAVQNGM